MQTINIFYLKEPSFAPFVIDGAGTIFVHSEKVKKKKKLSFLKKKTLTFSVTLCKSKKKL